MVNFDSDISAFRAWWRTAGKRVRRQSTCDEYVRHIRKWMEWQQSQPGEPSATPTLRGVSAYVSHLVERSEWVAYDALKALKAWGRFLEWDGTVTVSPLKDVPNREQPSTKRTPVAELADIARLLETCSGGSMEDARDAAIICLLRCTGMRRGELIALRWDDIDFGEGTVQLRNETVKSGKGRTVAFDVATRRALKLYLRRIDERELRARRDYTSWTEGRVWISTHGLLTGGGLGQILQRRSQLAGVDIPAHSFRRSLAMRWLQDDKPEALLMKVAGWHHPEMVKRYVSSVADREAIRAQRSLLEAEEVARDAQDRRNRMRAV